MSASAAACSKAILPGKPPRWLQSLIFFCWLFAVGRHLATALQPGLSGYRFNHDEAAAIDLARHAAAGKGLVASALQVGNDLGNVDIAFPLWPPGVALLLWQTMTCGLPLAAAYKFWHLAAVAVGAGAWLCLALWHLRPTAAALFALALALAFADPWEKLADLFLWTLLPFYLICLMGMAARDFKNGIMLWFIAAALLLTLMPWLSNVAVYLPLAYVLFVAFACRPANTGQLAWALLLAGCGAFSHLFMRLFVITAAGCNYFDSFIAGFHLWHIRWQNHEAILSAIFGDFLGLASFFNGLERAWKGAALQVWLRPALLACKFLLAATMLWLAREALRSRVLARCEKQLMAAVLCHAGVLIALIVFLEIRYAMPLLPNLWEPGRLLRHLVPLIALAWLNLLSPLWPIPSFASISRPRFFATVGLIGVLAIGFGGLLVARVAKICFGAGQAQQLRDIMRPISPNAPLLPSDGLAAVQNLARNHCLEPRIIFAVDFSPFLAAGEPIALPPSPAALARIANSRRLFVLVVTVGPEQITSPAAQQRQCYAQHMIAALSLPLLQRCQNHEEIHGRWIEAFDRGALATTGLVRDHGCWPRNEP